MRESRPAMSELVKRVWEECRSTPRDCESLMVEAAGVVLSRRVDSKGLVLFAILSNRQIHSKGLVNTRIAHAAHGMEWSALRL